MDDLNLYSMINSLPSDLKKEVSDFVEFLKFKAEKQKAPKKERSFGALESKIHLSKDFDKKQ
ncbi:hypothetical protein GCM10028791_18010 [Echinicola sediminis]